MSAWMVPSYAEDWTVPGYTEERELGRGGSGKVVALPAGTVRSAYAVTLAATGGTGTVTWAASGLPAGLAISAAGTISGTPTASGSFAVTVTATAGTTASKSFTLVIDPAAITSPSPSVLPSSTTSIV